MSGVTRKIELTTTAFGGGFGIMRLEGALFG